MRPAQAYEIVQQRLGQIAFFAITHHADRAVALGQALAVRAEDHRHVGIDRQLAVVTHQRLEDVDLARRVVHVVVAADDMGDAHVHVVDHHAEVVGRRAVGTGDHQIIQLGVADGDIALDQIVDHRVAVQRRGETDHRIDPGRRLRQRLARHGPPGAVVLRFFAFGARRLAHRLHVLGARIAAIGLAFVDQAVDDFSIAIEALGLIIDVAVVLEIQPRHGIENGLHGFVGGAFAIRILDAQHEVAAARLGVQPGIKRGACAPDVQVAGGRWGETGDNGHGDVPGERRRRGAGKRPLV